MKRFSLVLVLMSATAAADGHYMDNGKTITHDCGKEPQVTVMGNENTVTITGNCMKISIAGNKNKVTATSAKLTGAGGNDNTVTVEATDELVTTGSNNTIVYTKALSKPKVHVVNTGKDNKVTQSK